MGLWAGNPHCRCMVTDRVGEKIIYSRSLRCRTLGTRHKHLTFPRGCSSLTSMPVEWPPCPDRLGGGWLAPQRRGEARAERALCSVPSYKLVHTQFPPQNKPQSPARSQCCLTQCPFPARSVPCARCLPITCQPCCCLTAGGRTERIEQDNNDFKNFVSIFFL